MEEIGLATGNDPRIGGRYFLTFLMLMLSTAPMLAAAGSATAGATVPQDPPPEISLAADPMAVGYEGTTKLIWSVTHANSCTARGAWSGAKLDAGTETVGPLTKSRTFALKCTGPGGVVKRWIRVAVGSPVAPPTLSLTADALDSTAPITLSWSSTNATSCVAGGAWSQEKATSGTETVGPLNQTSTFNLKCGGPGGSVKRWITVEVADAPTPSPVPTASLAADPEIVDYLGSSTLTWVSTDTTGCTASGDWSGDKPTSGSEIVQRLAETTTYTLECDGPGGNVDSSKTVTVRPPPLPTPTVSLSADPLSVDYDGSTILTWSSIDVDQCVASGAWSGTKATSGTKNKKSLTTTSTFALTCTGPGGSASQSVTVVVGAAPLPTVSLTADPKTVAVNGYSTLNWSSMSASSCQAGNAWSGTKPTSGSEDVGPLAQTSTFTLTCSGPGGSTNRPATVTVAAPNGTADLSWVAPTTNEDGSPLTLASFNVYRGTSPNNLQKIGSVDAGQTTFTVTGLGAGTHYFAVTAVSITGAESTLSNVESKTMF
jgi:hypothetical protein